MLGQKQTGGRRSPEVELFQAGVCQVIVGSLMNVSLRRYFVVVRQTVHFMDEHLKVDVRVHLVGARHGEMQPTQGLHVVVLATGASNSSAVCQRAFTEASLPPDAVAPGRR